MGKKKKIEKKGFTPLAFFKSVNYTSHSSVRRSAGFSAMFDKQQPEPDGSFFRFACIN